MERTEKKTDRRSIKTKKAIRNAFAQLLSRKPLDEITVKDIAATADINRKTFYNYYSGVYQIIDEIENQMISSLDLLVSDVDFKEAMQNPRILFEKMTTVLYDDLDFYGHLLKIDRNVSLVSKITGLLKEKVKSAFSSQIEVDSGKLDVMVDYAISGMIGVYQSWVNSDRKQSIEEIAEIINMMCFTGIAGVMSML